MLTSHIYLAVFHSWHRGSRAGCAGSGNGFDMSGWPYDAGDDPAFYCARNMGANLTWGVCRPKVRNQIRPGDVVVFFSVRGSPENKAPFRYRFCAVATVERKVKHTRIWTRDELEPFRSYRNLLIRPLTVSTGGGNTMSRFRDRTTRIGCGASLDRMDSAKTTSRG